MKKKNKIVIFSIFILMCVSLSIILFISNNKFKTKSAISGLAVYVYDEDEENYIADDEIPTGSYILNTTLSYCKGNGEIGEYDSTNGTVSYSFTAGDSCYLYFDLVTDDIIIYASNYKNGTGVPTSGTQVSTGCANTIWDNKYQRYEITDISSSLKCTPSFTRTSSSNYTSLVSIASVAGTSGTGSIVDEQTAQGTSTDAKGNAMGLGYRYEGQNPNNWVWFNNEKWRMIGAVPVETSSGLQTLVKIIRNDSIGSISYDAKTSGYTGVWGSNTLYTLLNTYYYGKGNATGLTMCNGYTSSSYSSSNKCDYTNIGISSSSDDYYNQMIENVYWNTGAAAYDGTPLATFQSEIATQSVQNKIGLISASDYVFASSSHSTTAINSTTDLYTRALNNWLYKNHYEWTSIKCSSNSSYALFVITPGTVSSYYAYYGYSTSPVLYLKSSVYKVSGTGTEADPYILGV